MNPIMMTFESRFQVNEYNMMNHRENVKLYDVYIIAKYGTEKLKEIRLVDIRVINNFSLEFKFINMNIYCRDNYDNSIGYTNIIIDHRENLMYINYIMYMSKEINMNSKVVMSSSYSLTNDMIDFFKYLYKNHSDINKMPLSRL
jgi:hypothetical protein